MKKYLYLGVIIIIMLFTTACGLFHTEPHNSNQQNNNQQNSNATTYVQITQTEAKELMQSEESYIILDVRTYEEYASGHISGAICIPNETISKTTPAELPDKNQLILVYCRSGNRSKQASEKLAKMGYTNVKEFGGINTWDGEVE